MFWSSFKVNNDAMTAPKIPTIRWLIVALLFGGFLFGLIALAAATGWQDVLAAVDRLTLPQYVILLLLSLANYLLRGMRWHHLCGALNIPGSFPASLRHYIGGFAMTVTPGRLGELIRLRWIHRETGRRPDSTGALVIADRAADLASVGLILAVAVALSTAGIDGAWGVALIAIALAYAATQPRLFHHALTFAYRALGVMPRIFAGLRRAAGGLEQFSKPFILLPVVVLSVLGWVAEASAFWLLLQWLGADISLPIAIAVFTFAMLTGGATGLPGGIGGAEAAMVAALVFVGVPLEIGLPATAIIRLTTLWFAIGVGIVVFPFAERAATAATLPREA